MDILLKHGHLRNWLPADEYSLVKHANDPDIALNMRDAFPNPYLIEDGRKWLETAVVNPWYLAIVVNGEAAGGLGMQPFEDVYRFTAEVGYWLGKEHWGKGIMTDAIIAFTEALFAHTELQRLEAGVFQYNPASMRVLEKAGFILEAVQERAVFKKGRFWNLHRYAKLL